MSALNWLKANNPLYKDIQIDCTNISVELTDMTPTCQQILFIIIERVHVKMQLIWDNLVMPVFLRIQN